jgi:hypothetical protein
MLLYYIRRAIVSTLLSHLQALKGQIYKISGIMHFGIPNAYNNSIVCHMQNFFVIQ